MGQGGIIEYTVAFGEIFYFVADLYLESSAYDEVEFLAGMLCRVDGLVLQFFAVLIGYVVGLGEPVLEHRRHVLYDYAVFSCGVLAVAFACNGVGGEQGAAAFEKVAHAYVEGKGALVNECERKVQSRRFILAVYIF